jgi:integrase
VRGSKRLRGKSWQLRAYAGKRPDGGERWLAETIPARAGQPVPEREADEALAKLIARAARLRDGGTTVPTRRQKQGRVTVRQGFEAWLSYARPNLEPNGADTDEDILRNYVYPHLGDVELWRLRPDQLSAPGDPDYDPDLVSMTAYYAMLAERGSAGRCRVDRKTREATIVGAGRPLDGATVRRVHGVCRRAFDYCVDRNWVRSNPAAGAKLPPVVKRQSTTPTAAALAAFIAFLEDDDPELLVFLDLMNSGARRVDMALQWRDVSIGAEGGGAVTFGQRGLITARGADGRPEVLVRTTPTRKRRLRTVAVDEAVTGRLLAHRVQAETKAALCGAQLADDAYVFSVAADGTEPRNPAWFSGSFRNAKRRATKAGLKGLEGVRPYDVRHHMCTQLLAHGVEPAVVAERAGNSARTMDAFYRHAVPARDQAAAELMARIMREAGTS